MAYTDQSKVSKYLGRALTADEQSLFDGMLSAVTTYINRATDSQFDKVEPSTRYYDTEGDCGSVIDIDPCQAVMKVSELNYDKSDAYDYVVDTDYLLEPLNENIKTQLVRRFGSWGKSYQRVAVTAKFTEYDYVNDKVPDDIAMVAQRIMGGLLKAASDTTASGNVKSESLEGHRVEYVAGEDSIQKIALADPFVMSIINQHREVLIG